MDEPNPWSGMSDEELLQQLQWARVAGDLNATHTISCMRAMLRNGDST